MKESVSVIIPAFNEHLGVAGVVREVIDALAEHNIPGEVIVVDDGSVDGTGQAAQRAGARVLRHRSNRGCSLANGTT